MEKIFKIVIGLVIVFSLSACTPIQPPAEEFKVVFETDGGTLVDELVIVEGSSFLEPTQPEKEGYTFGGWYSDSLLMNYYNFTSGVLGDVILYAKWDPTEFTVSFEVDGGNEILDITQGFDSAITLPSEPIKDGYSFLGWYYEDTYAEIAEFTTVPATDITLYAKWEINIYIIAFENNAIEIGDTILPLDQEYGSLIEEPALLVRENYDFIAWYSDIELLNIYDFSDTVTDNIILYAKWDKNTVTLNWNIGNEPNFLDPGINGSADGGDVINQMFEGLVREIDGVVYPGIAESWETSTDGLTITFHLRESNWSDGTPLTAHDFVYSWLRAMNPYNASEYSWIWEYTNVVGAKDFAYGYDDEEENVGIEAIDDYTLEVSFYTPTPYFVSLTSFYHFMPVKEELADYYHDGIWAKNPNVFISNGPFILTEYNISEGLKLEKNEEYWNKDVVQIDIINGLFIDSEYTAYAMYYADELDFISQVPLSEIPILMAESSEFFVIPRLGTYYYSFNMDPDDNYINDIGLWTNQNLRLALSYSIDRDAITEVISDGSAPAVGFLPPGLMDNEGNDFLATAGTYGAVTDDGNFSEAVVLFATAATEMGLTVQELQNLLEQQELLYNTSENHQLVAEMVREMWATNLGFAIPLANTEWAIFQGMRTEGDFSIARGGWLTDFMDPIGLLELFTSWYYYNDPNYYNPEYDVLIDAAKHSTDIEEYYNLLYEAYNLLMTEMPIIPIYHYTDTMLVKGYVTGWGRSVLGPIDFSRATVEKGEED